MDPPGSSGASACTFSASSPAWSLRQPTHPPNGGSVAAPTGSQAVSPRGDITVGSRVRVVFGGKAQESGVAVRIDKEVGTCDVHFAGQSAPVPVGLRFLQVESPVSPGSPSGSHAT